MPEVGSARTKASSSGMSVTNIHLMIRKQLIIFYAESKERFGLIFYIPRFMA